MQNIIRDATTADLPTIIEIDQLVLENRPGRSNDFIDAIQNTGCRIFVSGSQIVGFYMWTPRAFRGMDFLNLLVVEPDSRRQGVASALLDDFRKNSNGVECWTSTNASNTGMIELLRKLEWVDSGYTEELDVDDPDLFYSYDRNIVPVTLEK